MKIKPCPFCEAKPKKYNGFYTVKHKADCWLYNVLSKETYIVGKKAVHAWNTRADAWITIDYDNLETLPKEFETVLTQHVKDLYPVSAYLYEKNDNLWMRELEGPEDKPLEGKHKSLYRSPTHWKPLPEPPEEEG